MGNGPRTSESGRCSAHRQFRDRRRTPPYRQCEWRSKGAFAPQAHRPARWVTTWPACKPGVALSFQIGAEFHQGTTYAFVRTFASDDRFAVHFLAFELIEVGDLHIGIETRDRFLTSHLMRSFGGAMIEIARTAQVHVREKIADVHFR